MTEGQVRGRAVTRFMRQGLRDVDRRLAALTSGGSADDALEARVVSASVAARMADDVLAAARRVIASSLAGAMIRRANAGWLAYAPSERHAATGLLLLVAVAAHLALMLWQGRPAGAFWLVLPGLVACAGLLCVAASRMEAGRVR